MIKCQRKKQFKKVFKSKRRILNNNFIKRKKLLVVEEKYMSKHIKIFVREIRRLSY
jgi:hypothetical protein